MMVYKYILVSSGVISDTWVKNHISSSWILSPVNDVLLYNSLLGRLWIIMRQEHAFASLVNVLRQQGLEDPHVGGSTAWVTSQTTLPSTAKLQSAGCGKDHYIFFFFFGSLHFWHRFHCFFHPKFLWEWVLFIL